MKKLIFLLSIALSSCQSTFYIVRHAEKVDNSTDAALSAAGQARANTLKDSLLSKHILKIYSTNFSRTRNTAKPLSDAINVPIELYNPRNQTVLIDSLKKMKGKNVLVVGHSNTVRHVVNGLFERDTLRNDLPETDFDNLFIVKRSFFPSKSRRFYAKTYGTPTN
ncbi:MAG: phosphoglycerate mutase family protein [Spirosomataceae bacterium]